MVGRYGDFTYRYDPLGNLTEQEGRTLLYYGRADGTRPACGHQYLERAHPPL